MEYCTIMSDIVRQYHQLYFFIQNLSNILTNHQTLLKISTVTQDSNNDNESTKLHVILTRVHQICQQFADLSLEQRKQQNFTSRIVVARDQEHIIGINNNIYWSLPHDMKRFVSDTHGSLAIIGNVTFQSFQHKNGFVVPLHKRINIVISSKAQYYYTDITLLAHTKFSKNLIFVNSYLEAQILTVLLNITQAEFLQLVQDVVMITNTYATALETIDTIALQESMANLLLYITEKEVNPGLVSIIGGTSIYQQSFNNAYLLYPPYQVYLTEVQSKLTSYLPDTTETSTTTPIIKTFELPGVDYQDTLQYQQLRTSEEFLGDEAQTITCIQYFYELV